MTAVTVTVNVIIQNTETLQHKGSVVVNKQSDMTQIKLYDYLDPLLR